MLEVSPLHILWVYSVLEFLNWSFTASPCIPPCGLQGFAVCCFMGLLVWRLYGAMEGLRADGFDGLIAGRFSGLQKKGGVRVFVSHPPLLWVRRRILPCVP